LKTKKHKKTYVVIWKITYYSIGAHLEGFGVVVAEESGFAH